MAPSGGKMATRTRANLPNLKLNKKIKKTKKQQQQQQQKLKQIPAAIPNDAVHFTDDSTDIDGGCSTPKAERFRIPDILTCPPAPKKPRPSSDCSLRRSPIAFFAPPELELFFCALPVPDISV
ncbi:cyclin-dependent protein kinase inhibitor SMR13 [Cucurbita moschata]|uniref:Cyclin-dependent protein kinase inhibitor SMR13 n=1 Tax=Cucurbita moschata TaxID=3662 RepID=A0A6J1FTJ6_CUCMO|nr:cyclin-dependent protein kinase inhibitor SMR13 [Cucurbita moschata]